MKNKIVREFFEIESGPSYVSVPMPPALSVPSIAIKAGEFYSAKINQDALRASPGKWLWFEGEGCLSVWARLKNGMVDVVLDESGTNPPSNG